MRINLVAVQAKPELKDYASAEAFSGKMASLMARAMAAVDGGLPTLVAFPELVAMYLTFVPYYWKELKAVPKLEEAAMQIVMKHLARVPEGDRVSPERAARHLLFIEHALEAEKTYIGTFAALAREHGAYVAAGSIALPPIEQEPSKGGRHIMDASKVYNTAYLFSSRGVCLRRVPKVNLTEPLETRLFDSGPKSELVPVDTPLGRIGSLVCYDGFHETLVEHYDAQGVDILLKPSYNLHEWNGPCSYNPDDIEGQAWLRTGCPSIIQGRENIRYGVNPMMVGAVFADMLAEGLSSIARNSGRPGASWEEGVIAMAEKPDAEEIIAATVEMDRGL